MHAGAGHFSIPRSPRQASTTLKELSQTHINISQERSVLDEILRSQSFQVDDLNPDPDLITGSDDDDSELLFIDPTVFFYKAQDTLD